MRITVLGGCGAWPTAGQACSGFLVEHDGFRLLLDLGYAALPRLLETTTAEQVDAVVISHGHPDHCADLNPLLRARALGGHRPPPLPIHALPGALSAVLALDRPGMLEEAYQVREFEAGDRLAFGPFTVDTALLPHWVPNAAVRVRAGGTSVTYTGDGGPSPDLVALAHDSDLLIAEATYPDQMPPDDAGYLTSAFQAGQQAAEAGVGRLLLTHLWPGTAPEAAVEAAGRSFRDEIAVAVGGMTVEV
ncbi:MBL fold metallo-hydrolase [Nonomuraea dietziae]|uniref:MBL fold metallo-hydrolase n=1 Tax=Nonomuraea dietziae TaxID=65515 RepID=UPI0033E2EA91